MNKPTPPKTPTASPGSKPALFLAGFVALSLSAAPAWAQTSKYNQMQSRDHVNQGNLHMGRRQWEEAIAEYQKAIDLDPTNSAAKNNIVLVHLNWGALLFAQNKYDEALEQWDTVLKLDPYNQNAKHNIAVLKQTCARRGQEAPGAGGAKPGAAKTAEKKEDKPSSSVVLLTPVKKAAEGSEEGEAESEPEAEAPPAAHPPAPAPTAFPITPPGGSLEEQLAAIELKVYGKKVTDLTVFKRLEKLETDTAGQVRPGTIKERIDFLKKSYGL